MFRFKTYKHIILESIRPCTELCNCEDLCQFLVSEKVQHVGAYRIRLGKNGTCERIPNLCSEKMHTEFPKLCILVKKCNMLAHTEIREIV